MIKHRQVLKYQDKTLIEKVVVQPPFRYKAIFQNNGCFLYIKGNRTKLLSSKTNLEFKSKEAVLLKCGAYVADWLEQVDKTVEIIAVHLYPDILRDLYKNDLPKIFKKRRVTNQAKVVVPDDMMNKFIESLEFYFQNPQIVNEDLLELKVKELMLLLVQSRSTSSVLALIEELYFPNTSNLRNVIELHKYEDLSVKELSDLCELSLSSFKREFSTIYNDTPRSYLNIKKIQRAKELLELPGLSVKEIAYKVGFNDPQYFTRLFKKKELLSPTEYRKRIMG